MALVGGRLVLRESFKTDAFWRDIDRYRCTTTNLMDTMAQFLVQSPPRADDAEHPLLNVLMVPIVPELEAFQERFGVRVCTVFNMTETSCPIGTEGWVISDRRSAGRVRPGWHARIVDEHDRELARGEVGELVVRSEEPWRLMAGYWRRPEATVEAWRNQWFHTGDLFRQAEDGQFYFVDRLKDVIRRRGENISSAELESYVVTHPSVGECAAVAVPSPWGEDDVKVVVVPAADHRIDVDELHAFLRASIPRFMVPRYLQVVDALPRTATNKIRKLELRASDLGETRDFEPDLRRSKPARV
jgi:carnitine-CoA ligase